MVVDYEDNQVMFKDNPDVWHQLPVTKKGLLMIPLTKEACDRYAPPPLAPHPAKREVGMSSVANVDVVVASTRKSKKKKRALVCHTEECDCH